MYDNKDTSTKKKKYIISHDYYRKVFDSNNSQRNINHKDNATNLKKVEMLQKINVSNEQPLVLFHKPNPKNLYKMENQIKKDLIENKGYINDGGYNKKLLKFYSYNNTDQNQLKNLFRSSNSKSKNKNNNTNHNFFNSKQTSFSQDGKGKHNLQKDYSNSIKKINNRPKFDHKESKELRNKFFNSININDLKSRNVLIKKLTDKNYWAKNFFGFSNKRNHIHNRKKTKKELEMERKIQFLNNNNISYDKDSEPEEEKNNNKKENNINIKIKSYGKKKNSSEFKDIKNMKISDVLFSKDNTKVNDNNTNNKNKRFNQFEYIQRIKKELNILRKSREKERKDTAEKKN